MTRTRRRFRSERIVAGMVLAGTLFVRSSTAQTTRHSEISVEEYEVTSIALQHFLDRSELLPKIVVVWRTYYILLAKQSRAWVVRQVLPVALE